MLTHDFPFDPTYGYDFDALRAVGVPDEPHDFETFWSSTYEQTLAVDTEPQLRERDIAIPGQDVFEIEFTGLDGFRVGGWLTKPRGGSATRGVIAGHGYGGRQSPELSLPGPDAIALYVCARGFDRSARKDLPSEAGEHVVHGIASRETYLIRHCVADIWAAASALLALEPHVADRLDYYGSSFGGGLGALAVPWDSRLRRAFLGVPTFGNHPLRLTLPCVGSGHALQEIHPAQPDLEERLLYFDAAIAAGHIRIPTFVHAALFDPAVPPPGQFAVYNALSCERDLFVTSAAHFAYPAQAEDQKRMMNQLDSWFAS